MKPNPGSDEAMKQGCLCGSYQNNYGRGINPPSKVFSMVSTCPLHGLDSCKPKISYVYDNQDMLDLIQSIKNRCDILLNLTSYEGFQVVYPTLLEDISQDAQTLVDDYCVKEAGK